MSDRLPPHDFEAEVATLGSLLMDEERRVAPQIIATVSTEDFYVGKHRILFSALVSTYEKYGSCDAVMLRTELENIDKLDEVGWPECISEMGEATPTVVNGPFYARQVRDLARIRRTIHCCWKLSDEAMTGGMDINDFGSRAVAEIMAALRCSVGGDDSFRDMGGLAQVEANAILSGATLGGILTGFADLDRTLGGLRAGEMVVLAARPSMGKTALGLNIAHQVACDTGRHVAVFSMEMSAATLTRRLLLARADVTSFEVQNGYLNTAHHTRINIASTELAQVPLFICDEPSLTPMRLRALARTAAAEHPDLALIVVDYLQLLHVPGKQRRIEEVGYVSRQLKALARELNIPVLVMSQLNRQAEIRDGHRPRLSDLRESGDIEQDADVVLLLHRPDYYRMDDPSYIPNNKAEVSIAKHRNGPCGTIALEWDAETATFRNKI